MSFYIYVIKQKDKANKEQIQFLKDNCTHVKGDYWFFEGLDELVTDFCEIVSEGYTEGGFNGMSRESLVRVANDDFGVEI